MERGLGNRRLLSTGACKSSVLLMTYQTNVNAQMKVLDNFKEVYFWVAVISAIKDKRQRRKRQSITANREKSQTPNFIYRYTNVI